MHCMLVQENGGSGMGGTGNTGGGGAGGGSGGTVRPLLLACLDLLPTAHACSSGLLVDVCCDSAGRHPMVALANLSAKLHSLLDAQ